MTSALVRQVTDALQAFSSSTRLYELSILDPSCGSGAMLVEAFAAVEALQDPGWRDVIVLSTSAHLDPAALLGQPAVLDISLANGRRDRFSGDINEVAMLGSDGGLARYRLGIVPWIWRPGQARNSRVWQNRSVVEIVDAVFAAYQPLARWRWSEDALPFMGQALPRSYCCQYRETDLDFVQRLLAEEGLGWRCEQDRDNGGCI